MKPRLESAPLTEDDCRVWGFILVRSWENFGRGRLAVDTLAALGCSRDLYLAADRCDADLMLGYALYCPPGSGLRLWALTSDYPDSHLCELFRRWFARDIS